MFVYVPASVCWCCVCHHISITSSMMQPGCPRRGSELGPIGQFTAIFIGNVINICDIWTSLSADCRSMVRPLDTTTTATEPTTTTTTDLSSPQSTSTIVPVDKAIKRCQLFGQFCVCNPPQKRVSEFLRLSLSICLCNSLTQIWLTVCVSPAFLLPNNIHINNNNNIHIFYSTSTSYLLFFNNNANPRNTQFSSNNPQVADVIVIILII